jgi:hypothetical protein
MGVRVIPSGLGSHRLSHRLRGPCCVCPMRPGTTETYVETAIEVAVRGRYAGEYIAVCEERECGYMGT